MTGRVEIVIEADGGVFLDGGDRWDGLRVRYRQAGTRRWARFIVVAAPGQSLRDLVSAAVAVVARSDAGQFDGRKVDGTQLRFDEAAIA